MIADATTSALTYSETLARVSTDTLIHMVLTHAEGTVAGDGAWIALSTRVGFRAAHALIDAERAARELDVWAQRMDAIAAIALAA